jgi:protein O-mannosyl-transferase
MSRRKGVEKASTRNRARPTTKRPPAPLPIHSGRNLTAVLSVLLAALTFALYSPVIGYSFIQWDADDFVTANPNLQSGISWKAIQWAFTSTRAWNWQPLTWISHAVDYQLFASSPAGHHFDSVLIHALNAVLLFLLLARLTTRVGPSWLVAALFGFHPLNVQSVVWVAERKNVLSTLFFFLAVGAYAWYVREPGWRRYLLVAVLFAAGLMAKSMVITLPFVLLLLDYWPLDRMTLDASWSQPAPANGVQQVGLAKLALEKVPLLVLSALSAVITVKAQGHAVRGLHQFPLGVRIENALVTYALYLWKTFWPSGLALLYPHAGNAIPAWQWTLSALVLMGVTALVIVFRSKRYLAVGWFWFLGTAIPIIGLVQVGKQAMADRYAYVPLIGIFIMIAWSLDDWAEAKKIRASWRIVLAICALAALCFVTSRQLRYWQNDYTVWAHALSVTERNSYAHDALAAALMDPNMATTAKNLDGLDTERKRQEAARWHFEQALALNRHLLQEHPEAQPEQDIAAELNNLGYLDRLEDRPQDAQRHYEEALDTYRQVAQLNSNNYEFYVGTVLIPDMAMTLNHLGLVEKLENRLDDARTHEEEALKIERRLTQKDPDIYRSYLAATLVNLGNLDMLQNRTDEGRQRYEEALEDYGELSEQNPTAYQSEMVTTINNLGNVDELQNRPDEALRHFTKALDLSRQLADRNPDRYLPDLAAALNNLGRLEASNNRLDDSRGHLEEALRIYRELAHEHSGKYASEITRVEASLATLGSKAAAR